MRYVVDGLVEVAALGLVKLQLPRILHEIQHGEHGLQGETILAQITLDAVLRRVDSSRARTDKVLRLLATAGGCAR